MKLDSACSATEFLVGRIPGSYSNVQDSPRAFSVVSHVVVLANGTRYGVIAQSAALACLLLEAIVPP